MSPIHSASLDSSASNRRASIVGSGGGSGVGSLPPHPRTPTWNSADVPIPTVIPVDITRRRVLFTPQKHHSEQRKSMGLRPECERFWWFSDRVGGGRGFGRIVPPGAVGGLGTMGNRIPTTFGTCATEGANTIAVCETLGRVLGRNITLPDY